MVGVVLGKAFPYPADAGFGALPVVLAGRSRGMEPAGPTRRRSACSCSIQGLCTPPPRLPLSRSLGPLARVLALVAYASRAEPGSYRGEVERPQVLDVQAKLCRGSRWALESRLMLSPLPMVVTAQKPRRFAHLAGFRFWAAPKACRHHTRQPTRLERGQTADFAIVK